MRQTSKREVINRYGAEREERTRSHLNLIHCVGGVIRSKHRRWSHLEQMLCVADGGLFGFRQE